MMKIQNTAHPVVTLKYLKDIEQELLKIGDLTINNESIHIQKNDKEIHCMNTEGIMIKILSENLNKVISRSDI